MIIGHEKNIKKMIDEFMEGGKDISIDDVNDMTEIFRNRVLLISGLINEDQYMSIQEIDLKKIAEKISEGKKILSIGYEYIPVKNREPYEFKCVEHQGELIEEIEFLELMESEGLELEYETVNCIKKAKISTCLNTDDAVELTNLISRSAKNKARIVKSEDYNEWEVVSCKGNKKIFKEKEGKVFNIDDNKKPIFVTKEEGDECYAEVRRFLEAVRIDV